MTMKRLLAIVGAFVTGGLTVLVSTGSQIAHAGLLN
jgi:hypothetical protein